MTDEFIEERHSHGPGMTVTKLWRGKSLQVIHLTVRPYTTPKSFGLGLQTQIENEVPTD